MGVEVGFYIQRGTIKVDFERVSDFKVKSCLAIKARAIKHRLESGLGDFE